MNIHTKHTVIHRPSAADRPMQRVLKPEQLLGDTEYTVSKNAIQQALERSFTMYGITPPLPPVMGTFLKDLWNNYPYIRFMDVPLSLEAYSRGQLSVDTNTYGRAIDYARLWSIINEYIRKHISFFDPIREALRKEIFNLTLQADD